MNYAKCVKEVVIQMRFALFAKAKMTVHVAIAEGQVLRIAQNVKV